MKISVLIPVYNGEKFIHSALECLSKQTVEPYEVVIVNDGSTDRSKEILDSIATDKIKVIHQENRGAAFARNVAANNSSGEIIAFLDIDDYWHSEKLEFQLQEFLKGDYGLLCTGVVNLDEDEGVIEESINNREPLNTSEITIEMLIAKPYLFLPSVMISREAFNSAGGFDESFETAEDQVLYFNVSKKFKLGRLNLPLLYRRRVDDSLSSGLNSHRDSLKALELYENTATGLTGIVQKKINHAKSRVYRELAEHAIWIRDFESAFRPIIMSLRYKPSLSAVKLLAKYVVLRAVLRKKQMA